MIKSRRREPCEGCPWRIGVDAWANGRDDDSGIPPLHFDEMVSLAARQDDGFAAPVMACHLGFKNEEELAPQQRICVGFALAVGPDNLNFRMLCAAGKLPYEDFACEAPLHPDFRSMIAANPPREADP